MGYPLPLNNTTIPLRFELVLTSDHITGATGKTPTVQLDRNDGLGFITPGGAVSELGNGRYQVAANATDAAILGPLSLHASASGCDPFDDDFYVVNYNPTLTVPQPTASNRTITVSSLITLALKRMNVVQATSGATPEDLADAFQVFGDLIDSFATERLTMFTILRTTWTLVSGKGGPTSGSYSLGIGGDINIERPIYIDHINYIDTSQSPVLERPLFGPLTDDAYAAIPQKELTSTLPGMAYVRWDNPLAALFLWMVPTSSTLQGAMYSPQAVTRFGALTDLIALPPGYNRWLRDELAVELWPMFREGVPIDPTLVRSAELARANVKRGNLRPADLTIDPALLVRGPSRRYSILSDRV